MAIWSSPQWWQLIARGCIKPNPRRWAGHQADFYTEGGYHIDTTPLSSIYMKATKSSFTCMLTSTTMTLTSVKFHVGDHWSVKSQISKGLCKWQYSAISEKIVDCRSRYCFRYFLFSIFASEANCINILYLSLQRSHCILKTDSRTILLFIKADQNMPESSGLPENYKSNPLCGILRRCC